MNSSTVLAVANAKGGSAKTTTAVSLAAVWTEAGHRVLLVDADPQASATAWIGTETDDGRAFAEALMDASENAADGAMAVATPSRIEGLDLVPSGRWVGRAERSMGSVADARTAMASVLARMPGEWPLVVVDCPPAVGLMTLNALVAAQHLVVPVEAQGMALSGVKALMEVVGQIQERMNPGLQVLRLVPCRVGRTVLARDVESVLRQRYGDLVSGPRIPESVRIAEAPSRHQSITTYAPENGVAMAYIELASELSAELGLETPHATV